MSKLTRDQKIEIYEKRKLGKSISSLSQEYGITTWVIIYLCKLIELHGFEVLREGKSRSYSNKFKKEIINEVLLNGKSVKSTSLKHGLTSSGLLTNWIKSYRKNGYTIVNKPKGRQPRMTKKPLKKKTLTEVEKIKALENELEYLRAENAYLKN